MTDEQRGADDRDKIPSSVGDEATTDEATTDEVLADEGLADEAVARVRAADPAADAVPDGARLRAAVAAATGVDGLAAPDELAAKRAERAERAERAGKARTGTRWLQVAAAVAAVALVGAGGYAYGANNGGDDVATGAPIVLDGAAGSRDSAGGKAVDMAGGAEPAAIPQSAGTSLLERGGADARMSMPWFGGRTVFHAKGLSTARGAHEAWAFDAASVYSKATAARVAKALGVSGTPVQAWGWSVGSQDGSGPNLQLSPDGLASVSYYDPTIDPWAQCKLVQSAPDKPMPEPARDGGGSAGSAGSVDGMIAPSPGCTPAEDAPSAKSAIATAKQTLTKLGVDPEGFVFSVIPEAAGPGATVVQALLVVDGQRTDVGWNFTLVAKGLQGLWGPLAPTVSLGSYDVVSATAAVERLNDPRFGAGGGVWPLGVAEDAASAREIAPAPDGTTAPPTVTPGSSFSWPVAERTITKARLGVAQQSFADGSVALVPTYELTASDGSVWTVIAVVDAQLDFS